MLRPRSSRKRHQRRLCILACFAAILGCSETVVAPDTLGPRLSVFTPRADDVLEKSDITSAAYYSHFVVRDSATWEETWPRLYTEAGRSPVPPLPTVDFQTHSVVVAMPLLSPPRYGAHVDSVVFHERGARVFVSQLVGGGMVGILEISAYSHVVRVPRLATVEFVERTRDVRLEGWPD